MTTAPIRRKRAFWLTIVLAVANLLLLNWIAVGHFARLDLTRDKLYTLAPATIDLLHGLDDIATLRVFVSEKRFGEQSRYSVIPRKIRDIVDEFAARSDGKLRIDWKDPTDEPDVETEARSAGLQEVQMQGMNAEGTVQVFNAFCGMAIAYGGKPDEVLPVAYPPERLEFDIAMALSKLSARETITIGFGSVGGVPEGLPPEVAAQLGRNLPKDENDINQNWTGVRKALERQFNVEKVPVGEEIPPHIQLLVLANTKGLSDVAKFHIDQFIMRGGKLVLLTDGVDIDERSGQLVARGSENDEFFRNYGITIDKNLVLDEMCFYRLLSPPSYHVPRLLARNFDPESALMARMNDFHEFVSSSIQLNPPPGVEAVVLARTTPGAWQQSGFFDVSNIQPPESLSDFKQFDMVGMLKGKFTTFFKNRAIPAGVTNKGAEPSLGGAHSDEDHESGAEENGDDEDEDEDASEPASAPAGGKPAGNKPAGDKPAGDKKDKPGGGLYADDQDPAPAPAAPATPEGSTPASQPASAPAEPVFVKKESPETSIIVFGCSRFLQDGFLRNLNGNLEFFSILIARLTTGGALSELQARDSDPPAVRADLSGTEKSMIKYLGMAGMPGIVLAIGVIVYLARRASRRVSS